jgi:hypothetical protein
MKIALLGAGRISVAAARSRIEHRPVRLAEIVREASR